MSVIRENHILLSSDEKNILLEKKGIHFKINVDENYEYRFTGEIHYSESEKENAALIAFSFDDFELNMQNCQEYGLNYSKSVGAFSYLNTKYNTNTFDVTIKIPKGVNSINVTLMPWYNNKEIHIAKMVFFQAIAPGKKRIFESCKQMVFSDITALKIIYDEPVLYRYVGEQFPFEFLAHFKTDSNKLVILGTAAIKKEIVLPAFQRHTQIAAIPESCMIVHDPTYYVNREILVGWYQGDISFPVIPTIIELIDQFLYRMSLPNTNVLFYGGSAGGFFSLLMAAHFRDSVAFVTNPQTNLLKFNEKMVQILLHYAYNDITIEEANKKYIEKMSIIELYRTLNFFPKVWYRQNRLDFFHYKNHMLPFLEYYVRDTNDLSAHENLIFELYSHEKGHNAVAELNDIIDEIRKAFLYFQA